MQQPGAPNAPPPLHPIDHGWAWMVCLGEYPVLNLTIRSACIQSHAGNFQMMQCMPNK